MVQNSYSVLLDPETRDFVNNQNQKIANEFSLYKDKLLVLDIHRMYLLRKKELVELIQNAKNSGNLPKI
jgi:hypothetical protein